VSTEPGNSKGGSGADQREPAKRSGGKPGKTVAAASAKPGRDEATVEITSADETKIDLAKIEDDSAQGTDTPEIAPVKDTTEPPSDPKPPSSSSSSSGSVEGVGSSGLPFTASSNSSASSRSSGALGSVGSSGSSSRSTSPSSSPGSSGLPSPSSASGPSSGAATPSSGSPVPVTGSSSWAKPSEPPGSVPKDRTDRRSRPFGRRDTSAASASGNSSGSRKPMRPSFGGTVLKDRPTPAPTPVDTSGDKPTMNPKPARKAQLQLARLEPWSVMKFSFVMSVVCFVVLLVAVTVLYMILAGLGVFDAISDTINSLTKQQGETTGGVDAGSWFSFFRIFGYTVLVGALNVMLITALSTVGSVIYNLAADLVGGVEVTLKEAD